MLTFWVKCTLRSIDAKKSVLSSAATDAARRISYNEVFINLMMLIKPEVSFFVNKALMRVSVVRGWVLMRPVLILLHFLEIPTCCSCTSIAFIFVAFFPYSALSVSELLTK